MRLRTLITFALPITSAVLGVAIGCSAPDPGATNWDNAPSDWGTTREGERKPTGQASAVPTTTSTAPTDGGSVPVTDSGPATSTVFNGAPAFLGGAPAGRTSVDAHGSSGNGGQNCLDCHKAGGDPNAPAFAFAGTVGGKKPSVEIRVVNAQGTEVCGLVKTDTAGNFWCKAAAVADGASHAAARNATGVSGMIQVITNASCNSGASCHGGTQGPIKGP